MGRGDFESEIQQLKAWHLKYKPIFFLPSSEPTWQTIWGLLEKLDVPTEHVWINYDDGDGACYLASFDDAPAPQKVSYIALYVTQLENAEVESTYLLTDQDIECETCSGSDDECAVCGGTGVEWLELDDVSGISRDQNVLNEYFSGN